MQEVRKDDKGQGKEVREELVKMRVETRRREERWRRDNERIEERVKGL